MVQGILYICWPHLLMSLLLMELWFLMHFVYAVFEEAFLFISLMEFEGLMKQIMWVFTLYDFSLNNLKSY